MTQILTIGHSNHETSEFVRILKKHGVQILVDIRSDPYSRYASQFNKSELQYEITSAGLEYRYSGAQVGGKPKDPTLYTPGGKPDYDKLASTETFKNELKAIIELAEKKRLAIMCSEADPMSCHRERIIAQVLRTWGVNVIHIMPDGSIEEVAQKGLF